MVNKWFKKIIYGIAFVAIATVLLFNLIYINNITNQEFSSIERYRIIYLIVSIGIAGVLVGISYGIQKIKIHKNIKIALTILSIILYVVIQIVWICQSIALPYADSDQVLIIARGMLGKEEMIPYCFMYLQYYPQQLTLSAVISFIFKILNTTNYIVLQYMNVICNIFTVLGLYAITKTLTEKYQINKVLFFIMTLTFIPVILLSTFVYGDFIGLPFCIWAVYFAMKYTKKKQKRQAIITSILIAIACLVRMNYFIFAIAILIYWTINLLEENKKEYKQIAISVGMMILLVAIILLPNYVIKKVYQNKYNLSTDRAFSTLPYLYMGVTEGERGYGWYNGEMGNIVNHLMCDEKEEAEKVNEKCKEDFKNRLKHLLKNPVDAIRFYSKKITSMWAEPTMEFGYYNSTYPEETNLQEHKIVKEVLQGRTYKAIQIYQKGLIILILVGTIISIVVNRKTLDKDILLLCLIFLGGFGFHLLWEAKSRYILPYFLILIPVASVGITKAINKLDIKIKDRLIRKEG